MRFDFLGYRNCKSHCDIFIVKAILNGENTSITNRAESLATQVCKKHDINPMQMIWIEHYPERLGVITAESWDKVHFGWDWKLNRFKQPRWERLHDEAVAFIKQVILDDLKRQEVLDQARENIIGNLQARRN